MYYLIAARIRQIVGMKKLVQVGRTKGHEIMV